MKLKKIYVHYIYSDFCVAAKLKFAEEKHRVEIVHWNADNGWESAIKGSYVKLLNADACWFADEDDIPFRIIKNRYAEEYA